MTLHAHSSRSHFPLSSCFPSALPAGFRFPHQSTAFLFLHKVGTLPYLGALFSLVPYLYFFVTRPRFVFSFPHSDHAAACQDFSAPLIIRRLRKRVFMTLTQMQARISCGVRWRASPPCSLLGLRSNFVKLV